MILINNELPLKVPFYGFSEVVSHMVLDESTPVKTTGLLVFGTSCSHLVKILCLPKDQSRREGKHGKQTVCRQCCLRFSFDFHFRMRIAGIIADWP